MWKGGAGKKESEAVGEGRKKREEGEQKGPVWSIA